MVKGDKMIALKKNKFFGRHRKYFIISMLVLGIFAFITFQPKLLIASEASFDPLPTWEVENPVSTVFVMDKVPPTTGSLAAGDSTLPNEYLTDPAIDTLLLMMEKKNIYLHKTASNPSGIMGSNNIVIIKGNFQWTNRNTPSTDRIKGLIWKILQHPDGFTGEILICDNTQDFGTGINHNDNNSEDPEQSIIDVINTFVTKGYPVYYRDWRNVWSVVAEEYSTGDYNDGFVYEPASKISYPKFTSPSGDYYISLRKGIWNSNSQTYDLDRLCIIDFPVLKAHSMAGATIAVKNWIGVLTTAYSNERYGGFNSMHYSYFFGSYALVTKVMGATFPRLTILDAAWTSASGPNNLQDTVNTKMLLGSTDPCAVSWYGAKFILTPIAINPNHTDPDRPGSNYRKNLENWTNCLRDSGFACTKDSSEISVYDRDILNPSSVREKDETYNLNDFQLFQNYPNPFNSQTVISFKLPIPTETTLDIYDSNGRLIKTLFDIELKEAGIHHISWDGKNDKDKVVVSGVYFYNLVAGNFSKAKAMILKK